jgi:CheY-like chemotaxis protein
MPHGGALTLSASNVTLDEQFAATSQDATAGTYVLLQVSDTGCGIPPEVRDRIFEPFFTTKEVGKGTGLGLSTVHTVVKNHGGFLLLDSEVDRGSTFKVYLPADPAHRAEGADPGFPSHLPRGRGELVLVIDDEPSIREITQQTLEAFGYCVITAGDGAEAVTLYAKQAQDVALVLTDMMMPIMDGAATIHVLKCINPNVAIIAASGLELTENIAKALEAGVHDFLQKPYTAQTLIQRVRKVIDGHVSLAAR